MEEQEKFDESTRRIYPKLSKEESDKQWSELIDKYKKECGENFGNILHPKKLTVIEKIESFFNRIGFFDDKL